MLGTLHHQERTAAMGEILVVMGVAMITFVITAALLWCVVWVFGFLAGITERWGIAATGSIVIFAGVALISIGKVIG